MSTTVSAVVPCRNERRSIEACVRSILDQEPPHGGFEVIVVDGASEDGTREVLTDLAATEPRLRVIDNPERITPVAMNLGIRAARGRYVAIMGAHNRYAPDYLAQAVRVLDETDADNVGGAMICEGRTVMEAAIAAAHHSPFAVGGARWHDPTYEGRADTVFGGIYRREVFERIGLFDEELVRNQDDELNLRLVRSGGVIWQSPRIKSWYHPRDSLRALFDQYQQYGYWKVRVIQKRRIPASLRHLVPAGFVLALGGLAAATPVMPIAIVPLTALGGAYLVCVMGASASTAWKARDVRLLPLLPAVFVCYHFGYGTGFLRGMVDFALTKRGPRAAFSRLTRSPTR